MGYRMMHLNQKHPKVFYGWWIVGACLLIWLYIGGVVFFGFTAVFEPIAKEFGWSYAQISLAFSLRGLEVGLLAPLVGFLVDRWGPRKMVFGGTLFVGFGLMLLSRISSLGMFYGAFALIAIGMSACGGTVLLTAVANWFRRKAGIATGIALSGVGLGGLMVLLVTMLVDTFAWRTAMFSLGLGVLFIGLPLSLLIRHKPEQYGYRPDGEESNPVVVGESLTSTQGVEINIPAKQALKSRAFWHIALISMSQSFMVGAVVTHVMPYLSSVGLVRSASSLVATALPVASISGRLSFGWFGDRLDKRRLMAMGFALMALGLLFFDYVGRGSLWMLVPFIVLFSIGWGGVVTTRIALLRQYFGRSSFGTILGFVAGVRVVGQIAGAPLAGWVFDRWGSYQGVWFGFAVIGFAGLVFALTIPRLNNTIQLADKPRA